MSILVFFAFLAGIVTVLSPCILPVLPIVLSSATVGGKRYPLGIVSGFILSFSFFTLFLTRLVSWLGISANGLRYFSMAVILTFGLVLVVPQLKKLYQDLISKLTSKAGKSKTKSTGYLGGLLVGASLGLIWTPCVGPILASVIALALTGSVDGTAILVTVAYAVGTAIPMLLIMLGGRALLNRVPWLLNHLESIHKFFGVLLIIIAIALAFNLDRKFQTFILEAFPNYGTALTQIEDNEIVKNQLTQKMPAGEGGSDGSLAPEIIPGGEWFNSEPLTLEQLKGKVVLVDFWTYTCINCIRTLPYIQSWHEKYSDSGLVIIGVHTPEFEFEKDAGNVAKAIEDFGLTYPVVQDNDYKTWRAYNNHYWPAKYFIDRNGIVRSSHFGEGDYDESEKFIQELLKEAGYDVNASIDNPNYAIESATPETYLGSARTEGFASPEGIEKDAVATYSFPEELSLNNYALEGDWLVADENSFPGEGAKLRFRYKSKNVFLVMNPTESKSARVEIFLDGKSQGTITVDSDRLYDIVKLQEAGEHLLELRFLDGNVEVYAFTFG